jgi:ribonuclease BN (tRNA processing enzyme)
MDRVNDSETKVLRRSILKGIGALALSPLCLGNNTALASSSNSIAAKNYNTRLILLGTTGGMTWWPGSNRASASQVLVVGDAMYIIDLGFGATHRLAQAFNWGKFITVNGEETQADLSCFLNKVRAVFLTHLHMDHIGDYPTFLEIGARAGFGVPNPLQIIGPGNRGRLEENTSGYTGTIIQTEKTAASQSTSTPGTRQMTNLLLQAFAQTFNDCALDVGYPDLTKIINVQEIGDPEVIPWPASFTPPNPTKVWTDVETCPAMDPFEIYKDDLIHVSAILVDRRQVYPAFAFRFDTDDGSLVISGDTGPDTKGNLQKLAKDTDVLVHEVIDKTWIDTAFKDVKKEDPAWPLYIHTISAHTVIEDVGKVAQQCGAKTLVLSHIGPGNTPIHRLRKAKDNFSGRLIIGEDLMEIGVGEIRNRSRG